MILGLHNGAVLSFLPNRSYLSLKISQEETCRPACLFTLLCVFCVVGRYSDPRQERCLVNLVRRITTRNLYLKSFSKAHFLYSIIAEVDSWHDLEDDMKLLNGLSRNVSATHLDWRVDFACQLDAVSTLAKVTWCDGHTICTARWFARACLLTLPFF
jgi:hypothetical protein